MARSVFRGHAWSHANWHSVLRGRACDVPARHVACVFKRHAFCHMMSWHDTWHSVFHIRTLNTPHFFRLAPSDSALSFTLNIEKSLYCTSSVADLWYHYWAPYPHHSSHSNQSRTQELLKEPSEDTFSLRSWSTLSTEFSPERLHEVSCSESGRGSLYSEEGEQFTADSGYSELFSFKRGGSDELISTVKKLTLGEPFPKVLTTHTSTLPTEVLRTLVLYWRASPVIGGVTLCLCGGGESPANRVGPSNQW